MTAALEAVRLSVERSKQTVLTDVSFSIAPGEVYALLGGNGAGKSTTLLTFLGLLEPTSGDVRVQGKPVREDLAAARRITAYLPEAATLYEHLSAHENLAYFLSLARARADKAAVDQALDRVALQPEARDQRLSSYSKGMRQKVAIALALLRDTPILLLDEPTSGLDPIAIDEFNTLVRSLADDDRTILMVTHDVYGACQVADRIGLLRKGELVGGFDRPAEGRIDTEAVHAAFAGRSAA
ncbi:MAG: ABC transporter ATP-binding protein [Acidobacteriota bacterium]